MFEFSDQLVNNPTAKFAVFRAGIRIKYMNQRQPKKLRYTICKKFFSMFPSVMYLQKNSVFLDELNLEIQKIQAAGLIDYWYNDFIEKENLGKNESSLPTVYGLQHVKACFVILIVGSSIGFFVFLIEILIKHVLT